MMMYGNVLECSCKHEDKVELVRYEEGKRRVLGDVTVYELKANHREMWIFIESYIGSENCVITKNAEERIFGNSL